MNNTDEILFIRGGPRSDKCSLRTRELEKSKARSFAARVAHAERKRKLLSTRSQDTDRDHDRSMISSENSAVVHSLVCSCELYSDQSNIRLLEKPQRHCQLHGPQHFGTKAGSSAYEPITVIPLSKDLWSRPVERAAFHHLRSVTAPWLSYVHGSPGTMFWDVVVPQLAHEFTPVRYLIVAYELIDLPAFFAETLAARREKTMGYYNTAIQMLRKSVWPQICVIVCCFLASAFERRWNNIENSSMHLKSCQKLIEDFRHGPHQASNSIFVEAVNDAIQENTHFTRFQMRLYFVKNKFGWKRPVYGIDKMHKLSPIGTSLMTYLMEFEAFVDDIAANVPFDLHLLDASEALRRLGSWDDLVHRLCPLSNATIAAITASFMVLFLGLFLIPIDDNGVFDVHPDWLVLDYILKVFKRQLLRPLDHNERGDAEMVMRLGLKTILRFAHEPRHAVEIESMWSLMMIGQSTTSLA